MSSTATLNETSRVLVQEALLNAATTPRKIAELKKVAHAAVNDKKLKKAAEAVLQQLLDAGQLHKHGLTKTAPIGAHPYVDPNNPVTVRAAILAASAEPQSLAMLIADAVKNTQAKKPFVKEQAQQLIKEQLLHEHKNIKKGTYGKNPPAQPKWHETTAGKKSLNAVVKATKSLLNAFPAVTLDEIVPLVRNQLDLAVTQTLSVVEDKSQPPIAPPVAVPSLSSVLKVAYDELCRYPEFRDRVVEIRRLYYESAKRYPGLTISDFHQALEKLQSARTIELHPLNEVQSAKDQHLALLRNDHLLYYVIWGK